MRLYHKKKYYFLPAVIFLFSSLMMYAGGVSVVLFSYKIFTINIAGITALSGGMALIWAVSNVGYPTANQITHLFNAVAIGIIAFFAYFIPFTVITLMSGPT